MITRWHLVAAVTSLLLPPSSPAASTSASSAASAHASTSASTHSMLRAATHPREDWTGFNERTLDQVDREEGKQITAMNPCVGAGDVVQIRVSGKDKSAVTKVELPEDWKVIAGREVSLIRMV